MRPNKRDASIAQAHIPGWDALFGLKKQKTMKYIAIIFLLALSFFAQAQNRVLKGRIVDTGHQSGIAYTNIGIEGTYFGTASDADGFFELKIPDEFSGKMLYVSAVGYENRSFPVEELLNKEFARIPLGEQTYSIEGIDVAAQSRVLFRVIRTAAERVPENYQAGPFGLKFHYLGKTLVNDSADQIREAIVELTDQNGYRNPSVKDAFDSRNYRFVEVNKNFKSYSFPDGNTGFDELLDQDIARSGNTIFNEELINDYDLHLDGVSAYEGDSVWVVSYKSTQPDLAHSGDFYASRIEGKLFILKSNYALVRSECVVDANKNSPQNRALATESTEQQNVRYHLTTLYQKQGGKYVVSYMDMDKTFINPAGDKITLSRKAALLDLDPGARMLDGRSYFEDSAYNEQFWNAFHSGKKL